MRGIPQMTTLPSHLNEYVLGLAKIKGLSISKTLATIVEDHFNAEAERLGKKDRSKMRKGWKSV